MQSDLLRKIFFPPGPVVGLTLIGVLLLSALLYYRSVKAQRYLEPAIGLARPRIEFAHTIRGLVDRHFGIPEMKGIHATTNSLFVEESLLFTSPDARGAPDPTVMRKIGHVFLALLENPEVRSYFDIILVSTKFRQSPHPEVNLKARQERQRKAERILSSLFKQVPQLEKNFSGYFGATSLSVPSAERDTWIEFRLSMSERLHIEVIRGLGKYVR